jgi:hypothetical protein
MNVAFAMPGLCPLIVQLPTSERTSRFVVQGHFQTSIAAKREEPPFPTGEIGLNDTAMLSAWLQGGLALT